MVPDKNYGFDGVLFMETRNFPKCQLFIWLLVTLSPFLSEGCDLEYGTGIEDHNNANSTCSPTNRDLGCVSEEVESLLRQLMSTNVEDRQRAAESITQADDLYGSAISALLSAATDEHACVRNNALLALVWMDRPPKSAYPIFEEGCRDACLRTRLYCIYGLDKIGAPEDTLLPLYFTALKEPQVRNLTGEPDVEIIARAIARRGRQAIQAVPILFTKYGEISGDSEAIPDALVRVAGEEAIPLLCEMLRFPDNKRGFRGKTATMCSLGKFGRAALPAVTRLLEEACSEEPSSRVACEVLSSVFIDDAGFTISIIPRLQASERRLADAWLNAVKEAALASTGDSGYRECDVPSDRALRVLSIIIQRIDALKDQAYGAAASECNPARKSDWVGILIHSSEADTRTGDLLVGSLLDGSVPLTEESLSWVRDLDAAHALRPGWLAHLMSLEARCDLPLRRALSELVASRIFNHPVNNTYPLQSR